MTDTTPPLDPFAPATVPESVLREMAGLPPEPLGRLEPRSEAGVLAEEVVIFMRRLGPLFSSDFAERLTIEFLRERMRNTR